MAFINQAPQYAPYPPQVAPYPFYAPQPPAFQPPAFAPLYAPSVPQCPPEPEVRRITYTDGLIYEGQVTYVAPGHPVPQGKGKKWWPDGTWYEGNFWQNQFHGFGELHFINDDFYKGNWAYGKRQGRGNSYRASNQRNYLGNFNQDREEGYGCLTVNHPAHEGGPKRYEGQFLNGVRHGQGRLRITCSDGTTAWFEGPWVNGVLHGYAKFTYHGVEKTVHYVNGVAQGYEQFPGWNQANGGFGAAAQWNGYIAAY